MLTNGTSPDATQTLGKDQVPAGNDPALETLQRQNSPSAVRVGSGQIGKEDGKNLENVGDGASAVADNGEGGRKREEMCCGTLVLNENVSPVHIYVFYLHSAVTITLFTFFNSLQSFVLTQIYGVAPDNLGSITGLLTLTDEIFSVFGLIFWGTFSDKYGRKLSLTMGYIVVAVSLVSLPHGTNALPDLLLIRLVFALGTSSLSSMLTAVLADYVYTETLGRASGILGVTSGAGAIFGIFVLVGELPLLICLANTFYVVAAGCVVMAVVVWNGLQSLNEFETSRDGAVNREYFCKLVLEGFKLGLKDRKIALSYLSSFLARGGGFIITVYIALWVNKSFIDDDLCGDGEYGNSSENIASVCAETFGNENKLSCPAGFTETSRITGIAQVAALVTAPFFGFLGDWLDVSTALAISALFSVVAYGLIGLNISPNDPLSNLLAVLWGIAQIAMIVVSQILVTKNMPKSIHGTVAGTFSVTGGFGIIFMSYLGGYLFDTWFEGAPFVIASILAFIIFAFAVYVRIAEPQTNEREEEMAKKTAAVD